MEKMAIYRATLKLIKEGKISFLTMAEIGYRARVSASAVEALFESRERLITFVGSYTFEGINKIIDAAVNADEPFEQRYFNLCHSLIRHYRSNPDVIPFLDHFGNFPFNVDDVKQLEIRMLTSLNDFFAEYPSTRQTLSPTTITNLFHENMKIIARSEEPISENEINILAGMFFNVMDTQFVKVQPREAA